MLVTQCIYIPVYTTGNTKGYQWGGSLPAPPATFCTIVLPDHTAMKDDQTHAYVAHPSTPT